MFVLLYKICILLYGAIVEYQTVEQNKRAYVFWDSKARSIRSDLNVKCSILDWSKKNSITIDKNNSEMRVCLD